MIEDRQQVILLETAIIAKRSPRFANGETRLFGSLEPLVLGWIGFRLISAVAARAICRRRTP